MTLLDLLPLPGDLLVQRVQFKLYLLTLLFNDFNSLILYGFSYCEVLFTVKNFPKQ